MSPTRRRDLENRAGDREGSVNRRHGGDRRVSAHIAGGEGGTVRLTKRELEIKELIAGSG